ncbi:MAG: hypothetical protein ACI9XC_002539 [Gammaproteobacteria bacterium]|jgi:hypothetical protein
MIAIFIINCVLVGLVVIIHYEALLQLSIFLSWLKIKHRFRVAIGLIGALLTHLVEVWIFGIAFFLLIQNGSYGNLNGNLDESLMNCIYFSIVSYTSLGYGDQIPVGLIRFTAGMEALTGLVLIAMTASFMYFQIEKFWSQLK